MWFERDRLGVHSMGHDRRTQRRYFTSATVEALQALPPEELDALHDAFGDLAAEVLVDYDPDDPAIDHEEEDRYRDVVLPVEFAFPAITSDFESAFTAHVRSVPPRWQVDTAYLPFELVGTLLDPWRQAERKRLAATWQLTARRRRGSRRVRRR
ncbi:hypothetical protein [Curtobacterium sp. MWU13-2055]|uniref:hypothetical protein n=1 Tax=Curtobacterium sp. MWU13-2055 TaxID=2931928 RepID=UPI00200DF6F9|nr:hypothetical protein [Curtobacterium sp. MWU13-2055]